MNDDISENELTALRAVARLLGDGYEVTQPHGHWSAVLSQASSGVELNFHRSGGRYAISAYARSQHGYYFTRAEEAAGLKSHHEITVSELKTPDQIARDIARRLLPNYVGSLGVVRKHDAEVNARQDVKANELAALRAVGGEHATVNGDPAKSVSFRYHASLPYGEFKISDYQGLHYKVELDHVSPELAARIIALLADAR